MIRRPEQLRRLLIAATLASLPAVGLAQPTTLPSMPTGDKASISSVESVQVDRLIFDGNKAFSAADLLTAKVGEGAMHVADFLGKPLTLEDLEAIRIGLTLKYTEAGYINSGAVIPDQPVPEDGALHVNIVEGQLTEIQIDGRKRLREGYLVDRIRRGAGAPLNVYSLRDELELLRQDPILKRINAELRPGIAPGQSVLDVTIEEANPAHLNLLFSNRRPPSVGAERFEAFGSFDNALGLGDSIRLRYGINKGDLDDFELAGLDDFSVGYSIPISPSDTTLSFDFDRSDSTIVEEPFDLLNLDTTSTRYAITLRQPIYRTPSTEFAIFGAVTVQHTKNRIDGIAQDISPGSIDGESNVSAVRFGQEFLTRDTHRALSLRSTFSFGFDGFDSNVNGGDVADSQFVSWLGQAQYVQRIGDRGGQFIARAATQLSPNSLLGPEQFAMGGVDTVRGYRENQIVRDSGVTATVELRIPLLSKKVEQAPILELAPFIDAGYAFNRNQQPGGEYLISAGAGLLFTPNDRVNASLYYGRKLNDVGNDSGNLQDHGFHFAINIRMF